MCDRYRLFLAGRALVPIQNSWEKQQQFVSDASHELRTPLAVIQSKTDVLFQSPSATIEEKRWIFLQFQKNVGGYQNSLVIYYY